MRKRALVVMIIGFFMISVVSLAPKDAKADLSGQWTHYVDWVQLPIHGSWSTNWTAVVSELYYTDSNRWAYEYSPAVTIYGFTSSVAVYMGLNYQSSDNAIGGWMQNTSVPNWGSFHSVRGALQGAESAGAATGE